MPKTITQESVIITSIEIVRELDENGLPLTNPILRIRYEVYDDSDKRIGQRDAVLKWADLTAGQKTALTNIRNRAEAHIKSLELDE